jgi:hypothetical protein
MEFYKLELTDKQKAKYSVKLDRDFLKIGANEIRIGCGTNEGSSEFNIYSRMFQCKDKSVEVSKFLNMT